MKLTLFTKSEQEKPFQLSTLIYRGLSVIPPALLGWRLLSAVEKSRFVDNLDSVVGNTAALYSWKTLEAMTIFVPLGAIGLVLAYIAKKWADELWEYATKDR